MTKQKPSPIEINLDEIQIDEDYISERVESIDKDLAFLKESKNNSAVSKQHNDIIRANYEKQISDNPFNFINANQMQAIDLILKGKSKNYICQELNISRSALNAWYKDDRFIEVLETTKKDIDECNSNYFRSLVPKALERLSSIFDDEYASNKDILGAVKIVLKGANLIDSQESNQQFNQTQIIINPPTTNDDVRVIENVAIDVDANIKKEDE